MKDDPILSPDWVVRLQPQKEWYPTWTCEECALKYGGRIIPNHVATYHDDICDICEKYIQVTEPRDYCYPKYPKKPPYKANKQKGSQQKKAH